MDLGAGSNGDPFQTWPTQRARDSWDSNRPTLMAAVQSRRKSHAPGICSTNGRAQREGRALEQPPLTIPKRRKSTRAHRS